MFVLGIGIVCFGPKVVKGFRISRILGSDRGMSFSAVLTVSLSLSRKLAAAGAKDEGGTLPTRGLGNGRRCRWLPFWVRNHAAGFMTFSSNSDCRKCNAEGSSLWTEGGMSNILVEPRTVTQCELVGNGPPSHNTT